MDILIHNSNSTILEVCRLCRIRSNEMEPLFKTKYKSRKLAEILITEFLIQLEIKENDELPQNICAKCKYNLQNLVEFQMMCMESQTILKEQNRQMVKAKVEHEKIFEEDLEVIIENIINMEDINQADEFITEKIIVEEDQQVSEEENINENIEILEDVDQIENLQSEYFITTDTTYYEEYEILDDNENESLKCEYCHLILSSESDYKNHLDIVHSSQSYCCTYCTR